MLGRAASQALEDLRKRADSDRSVGGLVLSGSAAREGMATEHSDVDVYVVTAPGAGAGHWKTRRTPAIDELVLTMSDLATAPAFGSEGWWNRYSFAHARVLIDRLGGAIAAAVAAQATLTDAEVRDVLGEQLDGYLNFVYRSAKSIRDGRLFEARLDAVESLPYALDVVFAFEGRVRPYNKYLRWELEHHPLRAPEWDGAALRPILDAVLEGDAGTQRELFRVVEREARAHDERTGSNLCRSVIKSWGDELDVVRRMG